VAARISPSATLSSFEWNLAVAGSVNKVILVGNVGADPEIRTTQGGQKIANFSLATSESWRDKQTGERKEKTEWHRIAVFSEPLVKIIEQYVKKGAKLYIEGALHTRKWTDQSGTEKYSTEVVLQAFNGTLTMLSTPNGDVSAPRTDHQKPIDHEPERADGNRYNRPADDFEIPF